MGDQGTVGDTLEAMATTEIIFDYLWDQGKRIGYVAVIHADGTDGEPVVVATGVGDTRGSALDQAIQGWQMLSGGSGMRDRLKDRLDLEAGIYGVLDTVYGARWGVDAMGVARTVMPVIDRWMANRLPPRAGIDKALLDAYGRGYQQGVAIGQAERTQDQVPPGDTIDVVLAQVHPDCYIDGMRRFDEHWQVWLMWPGWRHESILGLGNTRADAVMDAALRAMVRIEDEP